ncbi:MAG TPA: serine hydrolase domain-containing protein [Candidatus Saccharimonadales bacterium]|nr:serine hydrolase domain-containing protein [Candidatus Saccharimonadales bacterium]
MRKSLDDTFEKISLQRGSVIAVDTNNVVWSAERGGVEISTALPIASNLKQFTGTAIMQLRDERHLSLDDSITSYIPEADNIIEFAGLKKELTLLRLLEHRSGLQTEVPSRDYESEQYPDLNEVTASLKDAEIVAKPGALLKYSNLGYRLLELIVTKVSGRSHSDYVMKRIVEPLGMSNAGFEGLLFKASAGDLARWVMFNIGGIEPKGVLSPSTLSEIHTVGPINDLIWRNAQCLCWPIRRDDDGFTTWHTGRTEGFSSVVAFDRVKKIGVAIVAPLEVDLLKSASSLLSILRLHTPTPKKQSLPSIDTASNDLNSLVGKYTTSSDLIVNITQRNGQLYFTPDGQDPTFDDALSTQSGIIRLGGHGRLTGERLRPTKNGFELIGLRFRRIS